MKLKSLKLINYRNCENVELNFCDFKNLIIGKNAQGKTNILESIYFLSHLKSTRTSNIIELLKFLKKYPKYEGNIKVSKAIRQKFCDKNFVEKLNEEIKLLEDDSRIICRPSGTEAVIRISVESNSEEVAKQKCKKIEEIIKALEN